MNSAAEHFRVRLWSGGDLRPLPEGFVRCEGCRRPLPVGDLRTLSQSVGRVFDFAFGDPNGEFGGGYCRRCAVTQRAGALFLVLLSLVAGIAAHFSS